MRQRTFSGGWANHGSLPYRYVRCEDCHYRGVQVTVWLPPEASTTAIDSDRRAKMRQNARLRRGQLPQVRTLQDHKGRRLTDDLVQVEVKIIPGRVESGLAKRLPGLRRKGKLHESESPS